MQATASWEENGLRQGLKEDSDRLYTPFPLEEHGSFLALSKAFTHAFRLYSYDGKGVSFVRAKSGTIAY